MAIANGVLRFGTADAGAVQATLRNAGGEVGVMSLRMRIIFGVLAIGFASLGVFGDPMFRAMGFPPNSGRAVVAVGLLVVGIVFFAWTSIRFHMQDRKEAAERRKKMSGS
jgi:hypothetical protein